MESFILTANNIKFEQHMTFMQLVSQMQPYTNKRLCIKEVNNIQTLIFYDKTDKLPTNLTLVNQNEYIYCFKKHDNKNAQGTFDTKNVQGNFLNSFDIFYYVFGYESAKLFHGGEIKPLKPIMVEYDVTKYKNIILYDKEKYKFPYNDKKLIIKTLPVFKTKNDSN